MTSHAPTPAVELLAVVVSAELAAVHLFGRRVHLHEAVPRSEWLSLAGGVAVAYVFVHVLPEIHEATEHVREDVLGLAFLERHVYPVALLGFPAYYGVERTAKVAGGEESLGVFRFHVGSFALYNLLVGYLLVHREQPGVESLLLFGVAMGLHFFVTDSGLGQHHGDAYHDRGRCVLAGAVLAGTIAGLVVGIGEEALAVLFAFLAGGIVLNVVKEEVPEERESRFAAFAAGAIGYAGVLLLV